MPQVTDGGCPSGQLTPVATPWAQVAPQFAFVDDFEKLRPSIHGAGNLDRFDYWLNTFHYLRALMKTRCAMGAKQAEEVSRAWAEAYSHLLASVSTPGGLAMVVNMENHPGWELLVAPHAGQPWPKGYQGSPRIVVPTVRALVRQQESLMVKFIVLDHRPPASVTVAWRPLGDGEFRTVSTKQIARAVYEVALPPAAESFEYRIEVVTATGESLVWPNNRPDDESNGGRLVSRTVARRRPPWPGSSIRPGRESCHKRAKRAIARCPGESCQKRAKRVIRQHKEEQEVEEDQHHGQRQHHQQEEGDQEEDLEEEQEEVTTDQRP